MIGREEPEMSDDDGGHNASISASAVESPPLLRDRPLHRKYFLSLLQKRMPEPYTGLDATRLSAVYFCVVGLDMLGALDLVDKPRVAEYVYAMQMPSGFVGSPLLGLPHFSSCGMDYAAQYTNVSFGRTPLCIELESHLAMTYTALATLKTLGDDLSRINRAGIIQALRLHQAPNGCFQATKSGSEACDMRFLYCACAISRMLNDWSGISTERAVDYILSCLSYEGGFSLNPGGEAHGGSTYCAVASLALMGMLPHTGSDITSSDIPYSEKRPSALTKEALVRLQDWCLQRQNTFGICGRVGKESDTCYSYWIGATLQLLGAFDYSNISTTKDFIETCESDMFGGFSKVPHAFPDILHSFYSVAWSSLAKQGGIRPFDCSLAICQDRI